MDEKQIRSAHPARHSRALADGEDAVLPEGSTLYIGGGGDVCVDALADPDGTQTVFSNLADGTLLPVVVKRVYASGTTAASIVAVW